jgi:hypothetical protein
MLQGVEWKQRGALCACVCDDEKQIEVRRGRRMKRERGDAATKDTISFVL